MGQVFISFEKTDAAIAAALASGLEAVGIGAWYYVRDSRIGLSYLRQIATAITNCHVVVVVVSPESMKSEQVTSEVVQAFEQNKPLVPLLRGVSHGEFQKGQPEWRSAFRAATSAPIPADGVGSLLPALVDAMRAMGLVPQTPVNVPASAPVSTSPPPANPPTAPQTRVELGARFDHTAYPLGEDPLAYWLAELKVDGEVSADGTTRPGADLALVLDVSGSMDKPNRYPLLREAVRQLVCGLGPQDRVSVTLFSDRSRTVVPFMSGENAADDPDAILRAMDTADNMFGGKTLLSPALQLALDAFVRMPRVAGRVRRTYVLTDGELHDPQECEVPLGGYRPQSAEVNAYGFGEDFNAAALKRLVGDQIGGAVKPIVNEADIARVFAHVAAVNRRLVGRDGKLTLTFPPEVVCGDAWVYQPHGRYLGPIKNGRLEHVFGGIETGRRYSLLLEVRLPPDGPVAALEASWATAAGAETHQTEAVAARDTNAGGSAADVRRVVNILHVLRAVNDRDAQLASYRARRELAVLENRDPELITALDKRIAEFGAAPTGASIGSSFPAALSEREHLLLESDPSTVEAGIKSSSAAGEEVERSLQLEVDVLSNSGLSAGEVVEAVTLVLLRYVTVEKYDRTKARDRLTSVMYRVGLDGGMQTDAVLRFLRMLKNGDSGAF